MERADKEIRIAFWASLLGFVFTLETVDSHAKEREPTLEARALEISGFRDLAVVLVTAEPVGSEVLLDGRRACLVPCRLSLPPGVYDFRFRHAKGDEVGKNLYIEQTDKNNYTLIYRRRSDRSSTYKVARKHAKLLKRKKISTTIIAEKNNPVVFGESSHLDEQQDG